MPRPMTQLGFATILVNMDGFFEKTVEYPAIDLPGVLNRSCRAVWLSPNNSFSGRLSASVILTAPR